MREATIERATRETDIRVSLRIEGEGRFEGATGIGFFDHMLCALAMHGLFDLTADVRRADLPVDGHHLVEDTGICIGLALAKALGDKRGLTRAGSAYMPMDESLGFAALDLSGRPFLAWDVPLNAPMVGGFDCELGKEFFRAFAQNSGCTLHLRTTGENAHHMLEATFKAFARALRSATAIDPRVSGVPSTKGAL